MTTLIELSIDEFIRLFKLAFLGKLIGGLIHNINGPLQNLGLDLEMARYSLREENDNDNEALKDFLTRLKRMEEEFERIDHLIKTSSIKAGQEVDYSNKHMDINEYLSQELSFLHSNLYFKHNVHTEQIYQDNPPLIGTLSTHSQMALSWFLQAVIEEIEREGIGDMTMKTAFNDSHVKIDIITREGNLSEGFLEALRGGEGSPSGDLKAKAKNMEIPLILLVFIEEGVLLDTDDESAGSRVTITIPLRRLEG